MKLPIIIGVEAKGAGSAGAPLIRQHLLHFSKEIHQAPFGQVYFNEAVKFRICTKGPLDAGHPLRSCQQ